MNIVCSFGDNLFYVDKNGDGTWDIVKGTTLPSATVNPTERNECLGNEASNDPSRVDSLTPLSIRTFSDGKRFEITHEKHNYTIASELFVFAGDEKQIVRTYAFKEGGADILFVITRNAETNKVVNVVYSYNNKIVYVDKNGDGTWDIINDTSLPTATANSPTENENTKDTIQHDSENVDKSE
jgi:hypothetical protein